MAVDLRKLLKDLIRGAIFDHDVPAPPVAVDENGETTREELERRLAENPRFQRMQQRAAGFIITGLGPSTD